MEPKITLTTNGTQYDVQPGTLKNWADVMCSLTRSDYGGVVRKFTSQFDFIGETMIFLRDLYLAGGVGVQCDLAIFTMNDSWEYVKEFECPLDFSTIHWDDYILSISSVDSSLSSLIKASKNTKYEFLIGTDIIADGIFHFDRLPMQESASYAFTQGYSSEDSGALSVTLSSSDNLPFIGKVGSETCINGVILYRDDQDERPYLLEAFKSIDVTLDWETDIALELNGGIGCTIFAEICKDGTVTRHRLIDKSGHSLILGGDSGYTCLGRNYADVSALPVLPAGVINEKRWATLDGSDIVWDTPYNGRFCYWHNTNKTVREYFSQIQRGNMTLHLEEGATLRINADFDGRTGNSIFTAYTSRFVFSWKGIGDICDIEMFEPATVGNAILSKIAAGRYNAIVDFSGLDPRIANTRLLAAESIRAIPEARLYTSFSDFCGWMEAVFGYVYWIGEPEKGRYRYYLNVGYSDYRQHTVISGRYTGHVDTGRIVFMSQYGKFYYHGDDDNYYMAWDGSDRYVDTSNNPLPFVVYRFDDGIPYFYDSDHSRFERYKHDMHLISKDFVTVHFVHRSELFDEEIGKNVSDAKDLRYSVQSGCLYSSVEVGYDRKDYESVNGRDEFNFSAVYTTGISCTEKKLTLISKYRADSYGIEFMAMKRAEPTTDSTSDQDVFFVLCELSGNDGVPDRTCEIEGVLSEKVFNGAFSPRSCLMSNAGYVAVGSSPMHLSFRSATGNSAVVIDGNPVSSDIDVEDGLFTCGEIEFVTNDINFPSDYNKAVSVSSNGLEYIGFISDLDIKCFRTEAVKYKLIVKSVSPI